MNGHSFIDILKIDIEGGEFDALTTLFASYLPSPEDELDYIPFSPYPNSNPQLAKNRNPASSSDSDDLPSLQGPALPFGQLQLEIHAWGENGEPFSKFLKWWERLERVGLRPFWTEPNLVYVNVVKGALPNLAEVSRFFVSFFCRRHR